MGVPLTCRLNELRLQLRDDSMNKVADTLALGILVGLKLHSARKVRGKKKEKKRGKKSTRTAGVRMVLLILMELCGSRLGQKFDTTDSFISIAQTR